MTTKPRTQSTGETVLDTHQKALALNLDPTSFGSFAEIGAGQEVARWFLNVGAASGTVAKTVSAYDKEVSDDLYGSGTRYVSKPRLEAMLACEWKALAKQVSERRSATTRFFAFADTIAARNFAGTNDCHGWVGVRFQEQPQTTPSDILLHVNLRDNVNLLQQEAIGILGVNLLHTLMAKPLLSAATDLPTRLFDNLSANRIEIDQIEMHGNAFTDRDMHALHMALAGDGRAEAVTLGAEGAALAANEFLYKKAIVIVPIASDPHDALSNEAVAAGVDTLRRDIADNVDVKDVIAVRFVSVAPDAALPGPQPGAALITRHQPLYRATAFIRRYTKAPLRFALTLPALMRIFDEARYPQSEGRLLDGIARLFAYNVRVLAYPSRREDVHRQIGIDVGHGWEIQDREPWVTADQVRPPSPLRHLYEYLLATGFVVAMPTLAATKPTG